MSAEEAIDCLDLNFAIVTVPTVVQTTKNERTLSHSILVANQARRLPTLAELCAAAMGAGK